MKASLSLFLSLHGFSYNSKKQLQIRKTIHQHRVQEEKKRKKMRSEENCTFDACVPLTHVECLSIDVFQVSLLTLDQWTMLWSWIHDSVGDKNVLALQSATISVNNVYINICPYSCSYFCSTASAIQLSFVALRRCYHLPI